MNAKAIILLLFFLLTPYISEAKKLGITDRLEGTYVVTFNTPEGEVKVFLPNDISGGDTITAAIFPYPIGPNQGIKSKNLNTLNSYKIQTDAKSANVGSGSIELDIPRNMSGSSLRVTLRDISNREISYSTVAIKLPSNTESRTDNPVAHDFETPLISQSGRLSEIRGPFDGTFSTTVLNVGGNPAYIIAESPRKLVFEVPKNLSGTSEISLQESGILVKRPFTTLKVVKIGDNGNENTGGVVPEGYQQNIGQSHNFGQSYESAQPSEAASEVVIEQISEPESGIKEEVLSVETEEILETPGQADSTTQAVYSSNRVGAILLAQLNVPLQGEPILVESERVDTVVVREQLETLDEGAGSEIEIKSVDDEIIEEEINVSENKSISPTPTIQSQGDASASSQELIEQIYRTNTGNMNTPAPRTSSTKKSSITSTKNITTKNVARGKYTVQVASFKDYAAAENLGMELERKGYKVMITKADVPGKGVWSRVSVGNFDTKKQAQAYGSKLKRDEPRVKSVYITKIK